jgi:hypothetical protein
MESSSRPFLRTVESSLFLATTIMVALAIFVLHGNGQSEPLRSIDSVLDTARSYVARYERESAAVICEESYTQQVWGPRKVGAGPWETALTGTRHLASDFLLVWVPSTATWVGFRNVKAVDGHPVPDAAVRFEELLRKSDASLAGLKALADESSRLNLGPAERNFNEPTQPFECSIRPTPLVSCSNRMEPSASLTSQLGAFSFGRVGDRRSFKERGAMLQLMASCGLSPERASSCARSCAWRIP